MSLDTFLKELSNNNICFETDVPMSCHTTFRIGGKADALVNVSGADMLSLVIRLAKRCDVPVFLLGRGSNLLVSDDGIEGAVISLAEMDKIRINGNLVTCGAGAALSKLCTAACDAGLSGLEFAYGIPGSVGGALYMNAGAYGGEISQCVKSADCIDSDGNFLKFTANDMQLGYRTSIFKTSALYVTEATFLLSHDSTENIRSRMDDYLNRRKEKQPLEFPSAGSTFKRPVGHFAGALIEKNNLKGCAVGGARVSEKHAGFVINTGNATCKDVINLMDKIKKTVFENDGVELEPEVIATGRGFNQET